jgi:hypothetical protein
MGSNAVGTWTLVGNYALMCIACNEFLKIRGQRLYDNVQLSGPPKPRVLVESVSFRGRRHHRSALLSLVAKSRSCFKPMAVLGDGRTPVWPLRGPVSDPPGLPP